MKTEMMIEESLPGNFVSEADGVYFVEAGKEKQGPFASIDEGERSVFGMTTTEYTKVLNDLGVK